MQWICLAGLTGLLLLGGCREQGANPGAAEAVERCRQGLQLIRQGGVPPGEMASILRQSCMDLFAEQACRRAWGNLDRVPPDRFAAHLLKQCRAAYCPVLEDPAPRVCGLDRLPDSPEARMPLWRELAGRILARDLGPERARKLGLPLAAFEVIRVEVEAPTP